MSGRENSQTLLSLIRLQGVVIESIGSPIDKERKNKMSDRSWLRAMRKYEKDMVLWQLEIYFPIRHKIAILISNYLLMIE
jgi:hypothetical protein